MKKYILIILLSGIFSSCSGFLDEVSKDQLVPTKVEHYAAILLESFSRFDFPQLSNINYMTDDITEYSHATESNRKGSKPSYTWQIEIEQGENGARIDANQAWEKAYKNIAVANYVIELAVDAIGSDSEKDYVIGEAYFVRAFSYFNLVNLYSLPYNPSTASGDLGVPLRLNNGIVGTYSRATLAECYDQIEKDLLIGRTKVANSGITKSKWHPSPAAFDILLSRLYLYRENWQKAAEYASKVIDGGTLINAVVAPVIDISTPELIYCADSWRSFDHKTFQQGWMVSPGLISLYDQTNDYRFKWFFTKIDGMLGRVYYCNKKERSYTTVGVAQFRVAEAYLTHAEAIVRGGLEGDAVADMRTLATNRYKNGASLDIPTDKTQLLTFISNERRKELCFDEHHRWFDLRRMKERPEIVHSFTLTDKDGIATATQYYRLLPNDYNYTLPIPLAERENNPLIRNNERMDKLPETDSDIVIP